jgi:hypothetical protein
MKNLNRSIAVGQDGNRFIEIDEEYIKKVIENIKDKKGKPI